jgi:hypothetical protein
MRSSITAAVASLVPRRGSPRSKVLRGLLTLVLVAAAVPAIAAPAALAAAPSNAGLRHGADARDSYISFSRAFGSFPLVARGRAATIVVSSADYPGVVRVVDDLRADIARVTGVTPAVSVDTVPRRDHVVIVGTIGRSPLINNLVSRGRVNVNGIAGRWETSLQQVVNRPLPGVGQALVIAGSDQRGTIYGAYDVSRKIGVSPWYFWDDVPSVHRDALYVLPGRHSQGTPVVKYRGFFINDENPNMGTWAPRFFGPGKNPNHPGGFNAQMYARVFEVMLRLKANYLWPAVWGRAFADDDPANHATATLYGVVMGTSHEAPMMRGIEEWNRRQGPPDAYGGNGQWSFRRNREAIEAYFRDGAERMRDQGFEGVVTLGMRGNGDVSLPDGDGVDLMEDIIATQRRILAETFGQGRLTEIPQVFSLYKEVQRYWDRGLRPPDDVTVVFADDNWGNMRKLPNQHPFEARGGGYGLYYHFDYVGAGRNYKWVDTINLVNTWEQLNLSYDYGVDRLWVANVGDMKHEEMPLQFFLDMAWDPKGMPLSKVDDWERDYAAENFPVKADEIGDLLHDYGVLQARRKPELLNRRITYDRATGAVTFDDQGNPYSLSQYREMDRAVAEWAALAARADYLRSRLPDRWDDAYYQLVYYQIKASANLYAFRRAEFTNILYAAQGRAATNDFADLAQARFDEDLAMGEYYNKQLAGGKWDGMQLQPHIDYGDVARYGPNAPWQQPEINNVALPDVIFPAIHRIEVPAGSELGVGIDGSEQWWPHASTPAVLPTFSPFQTQAPQYIEVFNRGADSFDYRIRPSVPWVSVTPARGTVDKQVRATVRVDWRHAPRGTTEVPITVTGAGRTVTVTAVVENPDVRRSQLRGHVEANGYVSIEADHYSRAVNTNGVYWREIEDIGRVGDGMTPFPQDTVPQTPGGASPRLEYQATFFTSGPVNITTYLSPRNNVLYGTDGLRYAISVDDAAPQVVNISVGSDDSGLNNTWARHTSDNTNRTTTAHTISAPGVHTIKIWMVDPTVIVQNVVVETRGELPYNYLGPPESYRAR